MAKRTETEIAAFRAKSLEMREACDKLIAENDAILHAGGELMSAMFQSQQEIRGIPPEGYKRRPPIGIKLQRERKVVAGKPGFSRYSRPAGLKLNNVHIEVLNDLRPQGVKGLRSILDLTISEDGAQVSGYLHNREKNDASIGLVVQTLSDLLANPMQAFAEQSDRCCCCGKKLTDITSRLRGIGPECIKYFVGVEEVAAKIRHKFRCLDDGWAA